ncbi:MAG: ABC transporter ATP-binding protein [Alphaproteobacteria bacterium]|nr:ABC transporter ATP-binding protein [Alphaproteobacteria bacterium]
MSGAAHGARIQFDGVHKRFGPVRALMPTTLEVREGEFLTLLGPSGSGKTTLLNIAAGYVVPDGGRIRLGARDVTDLPPRQRNIGMVFQNYALFPHLSVLENVAYGLRVRQRPAAEVAARVGAALAMVRLDGFERRAIHELSGGQQQRVALARAMVIEPDLLLMDEPLGALDRQLRRHVQLEIRRLHVATRRTTIYVTHDQEEALVMSDRIAVMSHGRLEQVGTPAELYRTPANAFVAAFLGESNLMPARIRARGTHATELSLEGIDGLWQVAQLDALPIHQEALLLVRPEDLEIVGGGEPGLDAAVLEVVYLGEITAIRARLTTGQEVWLRRTRLPALTAGDTIRIRWDPGNARLLETAGSTGPQGGPET